MRKVTVLLKTVERDALWQLAERERRDPGDQAALMLMRQLEQEGLLFKTKVPTGRNSERAIQFLLTAFQACLPFLPIVSTLVAKALSAQ